MIMIEPTTEHKIPFDLSDEQPATHRDAISIAINTADLISELGGSIDYDNASLNKAAAILGGAGKSDKPRHLTVPAEAQAATVLIKQFDFQAFADAQQARNYITNKLVKLSDCGDPKLELKALELLGKHSDVGLFTERSEITVHHTTSQSLENSIKDRIKRLLNADITDVTPIDDLDLQLGPQKSHAEAVFNVLDPIPVVPSEDEPDAAIWYRLKGPA